MSEEREAAFEAWWNANETWPVSAKNLALLAWQAARQSAGATGQEPS